MARLVAPVASLARVTVFTTCAIVLFELHQARRYRPPTNEYRGEGRRRCDRSGVLAERLRHVGRKLFGPTGSDGRLSFLLPAGD